MGTNGWKTEWNYALHRCSTEDSKQQFGKSIFQVSAKRLEMAKTVNRAAAPFNNTFPDCEVSGAPNHQMGDRRSNQKYVS